MNKLPLSTVKQNLLSKFSVQLSPKAAKLARNRSHGLWYSIGSTGRMELG